MDPNLFRDGAEFAASVAGFCQEMRATPSVDAAHKVMIAGDPERATAQRRRVEGVPVGSGLLAQVRALAESAGAEWLLGDS